MRAQMIVENARLEDIPLLTELRLSYLQEDYGALSKDDMETYHILHCSL